MKKKIEWDIKKNIHKTHLVHGIELYVSPDVADVWPLNNAFVDIVQLIFKFSPTVSLSVTKIPLNMVVPGGAFSKTSASYGTFV